MVKQNCPFIFAKENENENENETLKLLENKSNFHKDLFFILMLNYEQHESVRRPEVYVSNARHRL